MLPPRHVQSNSNGSSSNNMNNGGSGPNSVERSNASASNVDKNGLPLSVSEMLRKRQESRKV